MRILLDTNAFLWWMAGSPKLGGTATGTIAAAENEILLSTIVVWEVVIKRALGRLDLQGETAEVVREAVDRQGFVPLSFAHEHALAVERLAHVHGDPFDRALIAQARCENATLLTSDGIFERYPVAMADARK